MAGGGGWNAIGPLKPTHKLLLRHVIPRVASKWHELGMELYEDADVTHLDRIQRERPGDFTKACTEMLSYWRETYGNATWNRLIKALKAPGLQLNAIALEIMKAVVKDQPNDDGYDTPAVDILLSEKPKMWNLKKIVIPEVKAHWEDLAYSMAYEFAQIKTIKRDGEDVGGRCTMLFQDWLDTNHGCTPKTWEKLLERIKDVDELYAAAGRIKEKLSGNETSIAADKNQTEDDEPDTPAVDILSKDQAKDDSSDTPAVDILSKDKAEDDPDTPTVDIKAHAKSNSGVPLLKGSNSTYVSSSSTNLWTRSCFAIMILFIAIVVPFVLNALGYSVSSS